MDVLLIGGASSLMDGLINKLNKEGNRIYILTGNRLKTEKYEKVFEKYYFPYESESVKDVFESVNPDVTVFTGAFDTNFDWTDARRESVRFSAGMLNLLMAFSTLKHGRFIYLSSDEVYNTSYPNDIMEEEPVSARGFKAMTVYQGETQCANYRQRMNLDTVVLRLDHLYDIPRKKEDIHEICGKMCLEAFCNGKVSANSNHIFSLLSLSDAVEFIYRVISCEKHEKELYHISSSREQNELRLAEMIQRQMGSDVEIVDNTVGESYRVVLSNEAFDREFEVRIFDDVEKTIGQILSYMKRHSGAFLESGDKGSGLLRRFLRSGAEIFRILVPYLENLVCFIPFFMLNNRAVGSQYFANLDFYLLYVLLFAIVYGQQQATLSAILSVAGYCFRQMYNRTGFEVLMDYNTYVWIAQLFILGLVVGHMRDQLRVVREENEQEMGFITEQLGDITDINDSNVRMKNVLITQVVNQNDSFGKIYEITSGLDQYEPSEVLFYAAEAVAKLLETRDIAIYLVANADYGRLFSSTSERARSLGKSIRFDDFPEMMKPFADKKVFINRTMDEKYPLLANAIYNKEGKMELMVMAWGLPWDRMTLSQANKLVVIGYLIEEAVLRANRYLEALEYKRYVNDTKILECDAFEELVRAFFHARIRGLTECVVLKVLIPAEEQEQIRASEVLDKKLRQTDYIGLLRDGGLYVLLTNSDSESAEPVIERFREAGYESELQEDLDV